MMGRMSDIELDQTVVKYFKWAKEERSSVRQSVGDRKVWVCTVKSRASRVKLMEKGIAAVDCMEEKVGHHHDAWRSAAKARQVFPSADF